VKTKAVKGADEAGEAAPVKAKAIKTKSIHAKKSKGTGYADEAGEAAPIKTKAAKAPKVKPVRYT